MSKLPNPNLQASQPAAKKKRSFCDLLFGRWQEEYYERHKINGFGSIYTSKGAKGSFEKFHACTQPEINR